MDGRSRAWFEVNYITLLDANSRVDELLDELVSARIFATTADDCQEIRWGETHLKQMRTLLDHIQWKTAEALDAFKEAMDKFCPHILERCVEPKPPKPPKSRLHQLRDLLTATYQTRKFSLMPAMPWVGAKGEVQVRNFFRDLMVIERHERTKSIADRTSTTMWEQARRAARYAGGVSDEDSKLVSITRVYSPAKTVAVDSVHGEVTERASTRCGDEPGWASAVPRPPSSSPVATVGVDAHRCRMPLCTHRNVAVLAGAGAGKTGLCFNITHLHSSNQLWPFFQAVLMLRLREPKTQQATTLAQLLQVLIPDTPPDEVHEFAKDILHHNGKGCLVLLDGVDELGDEQEGSFVFRLLKGEVLTEACLLATSRPCQAAKKYFDTSVFPVSLELIGFSEEQVDVFIGKHLDPELGEKLKKVLDSNPGVASLMSVPILALLICQVFEGVRDLSLSTKTKLYSSLIVLVLRRAVAEKRLSVPEIEEAQLGEAESVDEVPAGIAKTLLLELATIANTAHNRDKAVFDLKLIAEEAKCESFDFLKLGLLDVDEMKHGLKCIRLFSFRHMTIQEFFAALSLADKISKTPGELEKIISKLLIKGARSYVVLQFLAGVLPKENRPSFFCHLNTWLHDPHLQDHDARQDRIRVCLQCAQEASGGDADVFPDQLEIPNRVALRSVTASDLATLSSAVKKSSTIEELALVFDKNREESDSKKRSRVKRQTCSAMCDLATAVSQNTSLRHLFVSGPNYNILEEKSLANFARNGQLITMRVVFCAVTDADVGELSSALRRHQQLSIFNLNNNMIGDEGMHALVDALRQNTALHVVSLAHNQCGEATASRLRQQLSHIEKIYV